MTISKTLYFAGLLIFLFNSPSAKAQEKKEDEKAYKEVLQQRADKIVKDMKITGTEKSAKLRDLIAKQYFDLNTIQSKRDAEIKAAASESKKKAIQAKADADIKTLHNKYIAKLSGMLTPQQVEQVKDGMTYNVVPLTFANYLLMLPYLSQAHQDKIKAFLVEAREFAMDGGSSKEKHGWFGKYKGKITNYLTAEGYDLKKEGADWAKRRNLKSTDLEIVESNRVTGSLNLTDQAQKESVRNLLAHQYQQVLALQAERDEKMKAASSQTTKSKEEADKEASAIWAQYQVKFEDQRQLFVQKLSSFIDSTQVELVQNEMTDKGLQTEYAHFLALLPDLKEAEKKQVYAYLLEARNNAISVLKQKDREKWFIKFRGRANNYLAKQGYNLRKATEDLEKKQALQQEAKN